MILLNWTGMGLREDSGGSGRFGASRGTRKHQGYDRLCLVGQDVFAPMRGKMVRSYPYIDDKKYTGCAIWADDFMIKMWYFTPIENILFTIVEAGQVIGQAQDISAKYGGGMQPHVHLGLWGLHPTTLLNPEMYFQDADNHKLQEGGY